MRLFREYLKEGPEESKDDSKDKSLTQLQMDELKKLIRKGTAPNKETGEFEPWANAIHLVHTAYKVAGIDRPTPSDEKKWKQYEDNISIAVKELSDTRGIDGDWRLSQYQLRDK